ncbi:hypothetical protein I6N98_11375 [Spongiibacter nanhainus]|uniref:Uncharacterized protein n=1 Tax=Spongiibacter nanhainus TaxID=2794344 RepID=A0A7T4QY76_9GAMM|nr:hypothetical protein [Spongiibacter nanhainus]QQD16980.1 hypothetical protein I6N98_11375 [Spongiibacter nanhainus]
MGTIFVIQNQYGHYLSKQSEWVDGRDKRILYRTVHRDEAVNTVFELSSKDVALRAAPLECEVDENNHPKVEHAPAMFTPSERAGGEGTVDNSAEEETQAASAGGNKSENL